MKKVDAYTLPELVVAMVISSILIIIILTAYRFISYQFSVFYQRSLAAQELIIADQLLRNDIKNSRSVSHEEDNTIVFNTRDNLEVIYSFENNYLEREGYAGKEKFPINIEKLHFSYLQFENYETKNLTGITIDLLMNGHFINLSYRKSYDNSFYFRKMKQFERRH
ncbi:prepilin-type N-terminal cleavage/methylation domain-containing protein [Marinilabilia sp.]|uniref:prepilin-type N-terminal cleavage/methylation domain-containing protein n=1 Tax=Marinilabilia sp. TaxID=2021252 RepID=UPI0025C2DA7C|nr:prepilin-type N-terminal cleavage/methylation domain-containing protein [Marinilabilia sp.]